MVVASSSKVFSIVLSPSSYFRGIEDIRGELATSHIELFTG